MQKQTKAEDYLKKQIGGLTTTLYSCFLLTLFIASNIKMQFKTAIYLTLILTIFTFIGLRFINRYFAKSKFKSSYSYKFDKNREQLVKEISNQFNNLIKNKKLNRNDVITIKELLNEGMNTGIYKDYKFKNDAHEIYIKIKDKQLSKKQLDIIKSYLNICAQEKELENQD